MVVSRFKMVFTKEELNRITIKNNFCNKLKITADVHGMKCYEAQRFISNIINLVRATFQLIVIHGYNRGTAIKDMLAYNFTNEHIYEKYPDSTNQGITHIIIIF